MQYFHDSRVTVACFRYQRLSVSITAMHPRPTQPSIPPGSVMSTITLMLTWPLF